MISVWVGLNTEQSLLFRRLKLEDRKMKMAGNSNGLKSLIENGVGDDDEAEDDMDLFAPHVFYHDRV